MLRNDWLRLVRPMQWPKNAVVLAALVFGRVYDDPVKVAAAIGAMISFCLVSSAGYILNDWMDIESDRLHPVKRTRPLASGAISSGPALALAVVLATAGFAIAVLITPWLALVLAGYAFLTLGYSAWLKRIPIVDVLAIATGFLLRAVAGGVAIEVRISAWLVLCSFLLALFLGFSKRRHELVSLGASATGHRRALQGYDPRVLDQYIWITAGAAVVAYSIYTFTAESVPENASMMLTIPFVVFAIFRYLHLVYRRYLGGAPEILLFRDRPLLLSIVLWAATIGLIFLFN